MGTAMCIRLLIYTGIALFIIRPAYMYLVVCITLHIFMMFTNSGSCSNCYDELFWLLLSSEKSVDCY